MTRAVLFDLGNTLHHLDHGWIAACLSAHGHPTTGRQVHAAEYQGKAAIDARFRARADPGSDASRQTDYVGIILDALGVPPARRPAIAAALHAENQRASLWRVMHDDTPAVLAALRDRGLRLAVVSNADGRVAAALAASGIDRHFAAIVDSHVVGVEKPDPRIFHLALAACDVDPSEALFVGDIYEIDVVGARNAGMEAVLIDQLSLYGEVDCRRIAHLRELLALV
ncbi:HAD family hydrolase [bacterium]|nr:HAD family hydrolase [bacterium]